MMKKSIGSVVGLLFIAQGSLAEVQPQGIDMGPGKLIPTLNVSETYDDNIFNQPNNEESSSILSLKPQLQFLAEDNANTYALTYVGDYGIYHSSDDDNYDEHGLSLDALLDMSARTNVTLAGSYETKHDARGTGSSEGGAAQSRTSPDEYDLVGASIIWDFGADDARFGAQLSASYSDIEYTNNRLETQFRDRDENKFSGKLFGRLQSKTRVFVQIESGDIEYNVLPITGGALDSDLTVMSLGVEWEATGKTTGSIKIGRTDKEFDSASLIDADLNTWEAEIVWSPRSYSNVYLTSSSSPQETNGTGSFIDSRTTEISWLHDWSGVLHSSFSVAAGNDEYEGDPRSDDRTNYSIGVNYDFDRWMNIGLAYSYQELDSNNAVFSYDKSSIALSFDLSL